MILNKIDLLPYLDFDMETAARHARHLNAALPVFKISCRTGDGLGRGMIGSVRLSAPNAAHQTNKTHVLRLNISCLKRYAGTQYPCIPFPFQEGWS